MKKSVIIISFFVSALFSQLALGQAIGINVGAQITNLNSYQFDKDKIEPQSILTSNIGAVFNFGYKRKISFQTEINYSPKGMKYTDGKELIKQVNNYIEIPFLLKGRFGKNKLKFISTVGLTGGFPFTIKTTNGDEKVKTNVLDTQSSEYLIDFGLAAGAGAEYKLSRGSLFMEARYNCGLAETIADFDYNTSALRFSVGYLFHL